MVDETSRSACAGKGPVGEAAHSACVLGGAQAGPVDPAQWAGRCTACVGADDRRGRVERWSAALPCASQRRSVQRASIQRDIRGFPLDCARPGEGAVPSVAARGRSCCRRARGGRNASSSLPRRTGSRSRSRWRASQHRCGVSASRAQHALVGPASRASAASRAFAASALVHALVGSRACLGDRATPGTRTEDGRLSRPARCRARDHRAGLHPRTHPGSHLQSEGGRRPRSGQARGEAAVSGDRARALTRRGELLSPRTAQPLAGRVRSLIVGALDRVLVTLG